jgi:signal transduction histidine kinase
MWDHPTVPAFRSGPPCWLMDSNANVSTAGRPVPSPDPAAPAAGGAACPPHAVSFAGDAASRQPESQRLEREPGDTCPRCPECERLRRRVADLESKVRDGERDRAVFLAMLGHELRNPLAPIWNAVALLRRLEPGEAPVRWAGGLIARHLRHLQRLVDDLLDAARATTGKITLRLATTDMRLVLERAMELSRPQIEARQHYLELDAGTEPLWVRGDEDRLVQACANLLDNAARYTPSGGRIVVRATGTARGPSILVRDNGRGISPALLPRIFEPFVQGERSPDRTEGGLGLGLALVERIVSLHSGTITARSRAPDPGAEFELTLPGASAP